MKWEKLKEYIADTIMEIKRDSLPSGREQITMWTLESILTKMKKIESGELKNDKNIRN